MAEVSRNAAEAEHSGAVLVGALKEEDSPVEVGSAHAAAAAAEVSPLLARRSAAAERLSVVSTCRLPCQCRSSRLPIMPVCACAKTQRPTKCSQNLGNVGLRHVARASLVGGDQIWMRCAVWHNVGGQWEKERPIRNRCWCCRG